MSFSNPIEINDDDDDEYDPNDVGEEERDNDYPLDEEVDDEEIRAIEENKNISIKPRTSSLQIIEFLLKLEKLQKLALKTAEKTAQTTTAKTDKPSFIHVSESILRGSQPDKTILQKNDKIPIGQNIQFVNQNPLPFAQTLTKLSTSNSTLIICFTSEVIGKSWYEAGPQADFDETDLLTSSNLYPHLMSSKLTSLFPLYGKNGILFPEVDIWRLGEGFKLPIHSNVDPKVPFIPLAPIYKCSVLFVPLPLLDDTNPLLITEEKTTSTSTSTSTQNMVDFLFRSTLADLIPSSSHSSLSNLINSRNNNTNDNKKINKTSPSTSDLFHFIFQIASHYKYSNVVLPLGRWQRNNYEALDIGNRLAKSLSMPINKGNMNFNLFITIAPEFAYWMPGVKSAINSFKNKTMEEQTQKKIDLTKSTVVNMNVDKTKIKDKPIKNKKEKKKVKKEEKEDIKTVQNNIMNNDRISQLMKNDLVKKKKK